MSADRFTAAFERWRDTDAAATATGSKTARADAERQRKALHDSPETQRARQRLNGRAAPRDPR